MVFLEVEMQGNVIAPSDQLDSKGALLRKAVMARLIDDIARCRASKEHGYYVAVNTLSSIGEGQVDDQTGEVIFPVSFSCTTMKCCKGEILIGTVDKVVKFGIFLKCGPIDSIFLPDKMTKDYKFSMEEEPMFVSANLQSRMKKGTEVMFKVHSIRWIEWVKEFHVLATIAGDYLGPI